MQIDLHIRVAERDDLPSLLELYQQLNPDDPMLPVEEAERIWTQLSAYPGSRVFVGLAGGAVVSTCVLLVVPNLTRGGSPFALIENVVTDAGHRRKGYGRAVLTAAIAAAWRQDCYKVMLMTGSKDPATLTFYQAAGFEQSKTGFQIRRLPPRGD